jgi:hypothetical protein
LKIIKQSIGFAVGVTVGACLSSVLKLRPLSAVRWWQHHSPPGAPSLGRLNRPMWVQKTLPQQPPTSKEIPSGRLTRGRAVTVAGHRSERIFDSTPRRVEPNLRANMTLANASALRAATTIFRTIGYVEKAAGEVDAIILQENEIQVVHVGDLIASRYRVIKILPDSVDTVDESLEPSPMAKPTRAIPKELSTASLQPLSSSDGDVPWAQPERVAADSATNPAPIRTVAESAAVAMLSSQAASQANPKDDSTSPRVQTIALNPNVLGYVEKVDGKTESVVADGDTVRLLPRAPEFAAATELAGPSTPQEHRLPFGRRPDFSSGGATAGGRVTEISFTSRGAARPGPYAIHELLQIPTPRIGGQLRADSHGTAGADQPLESLSRGSDVPASPFPSAPQKLTQELNRRPVLFKPLGFIEKADGHGAAVLLQNDEVYIVQQGDRFAGHYRALTVAADAVEAVEDLPREPFRQPPREPAISADSGLGLASFARPILPAQAGGAYDGGAPSSAGKSKYDSVNGRLTAPGRKGGAPGTTPQLHPTDLYARDGTRENDAAVGDGARKSRHSPSQEAPSTFVFQTLGYVQSQNGELRAVVADESDIYLVKQGEVFADKYLATSVDPVLVLAVKAMPQMFAATRLSAHPSGGSKPTADANAGNLHYPWFQWTYSQSRHQVDASCCPDLIDWGANPQDPSLARIAFQPGFSSTDNPIAFLPISARGDKDVQ